MEFGPFDSLYKDRSLRYSLDGDHNPLVEDIQAYHEQTAWVHAANDESCAVLLKLQKRSKRHCFVIIHCYTDMENNGGGRE